MVEASANPTSEIIRIRLRPRKSAIRPPSSSSAPNGSAYAVTIHWVSLGLMPMSAAARGIATFTMVASRITISWAMAMTSNAIQRFGSGTSAASDA